MATLLDAGALVAVDKADRKLGAMLRVIQRESLPLRTSATVVAEVWRDGKTQANLARVLAGVEVVALDRNDAREAGELQRTSRTSDIADAHFALLAEPDDRILTSDPDDIGRLLDARGVRAHMIRV